MKQPFKFLARRSVAAAKPDSPDAQQKFFEGLALHNAGRLSEAQALYEQALELHPGHADALHFSGVIAFQAGNLPLAVELIDKAISLNPGSAAYHSNRGLALQGLERFGEALASFDQALRLDPGLAEPYANRANTLKHLNRFEESIASCEQALRLKPDYAEAHYNRGSALMELGRLDAALGSYDRALSIKPDYAEVWCNRSIALAELRRPEDAIASAEQAVALQPGLAAAYLNLALSQLLVLDFAQGWENYEWRWKITRAKPENRAGQSLWLGKESLAGKKILLRAEQGLGDTLHFSRYASMVSDLGAHVIFEVPKSLLAVMRNLRGVKEVVEKGSALPLFDYYCPLLSLPLAFKTDLATIPSSVRYIESDPAKTAQWRAKLGEKTKFRVGLVWSGGLRPDQPELWRVNGLRNTRLSALAPLKNAAVEFYSLQKGQPAESEFAQVQSSGWDGPPIIDFTGELKDFADTAALIENLDLVISVDTSTAHLAGALGKPVWILARFNACWRWMQDRDDSPWYPTARLFRQTKVGEWGDVAERVRAALDAIVAGKETPS